MKIRNSVPSKNNDLGGQFKSLDNQEMNNLKGGGAVVIPLPPLPPSGGVDFPLSVANNQKIPVLVIQVNHSMPAAAGNAAVSFI